MNLSEFKAWFEGFTENLEGPPNKKAWDKIQAKVKQIEDAPPISYPVYIDRYVRPYRDYWHPYWMASVNGTAMDYRTQMNAQQQMSAAQGGAPVSKTCGQLTDSPETPVLWNSQDGFRDLGRAEAKAMAAA